MLSLHPGQRALVLLRYRDAGVPLRDAIRALDRDHTSPAEAMRAGVIKPRTNKSVPGSGWKHVGGCLWSICAADVEMKSPEEIY